MAKTDFRIREMTEDDIEKVKYMHCYDPSLEELWLSNFHGYFSGEDSLCLIAQYGEEIAEYVLSTSDAPAGCIQYILVTDKYKRNCIGYNLFDTAINILRTRGVKNVSVSIHTQNNAALNLSRKFGFQLREIDLNSHKRYIGSLEL